MFKKILPVFLMLMLVFCLCACNGGTESAVTTSAEENSEAQSELQQEANGFTLYYPGFMQELEGETLELEAAPERIVCLSNTALQVLVRCDVHPIAVTSLSASADFPDWVRELPTIQVGMSGLDIEGIVAMEPDLVMVGEYQKETYGKQFDDAGIKVYYTTEGPSVTYSETRDGSVAIARSFGDEALVDEIEKEFAAVEQRCAEYSDAHEKKSMMIYDELKPMLYLGHEYAMRLKKKGIAIAHTDMGSSMLGFEVTLFLLRQLTAAADEAREIRKEVC